jgi:ATP-dependent DNA ligase
LTPSLDRRPEIIVCVGQPPDLLHLDGENLMALPLVDRKTRLASLLDGAPECLRYSDHQIGHGPAFHRLACEHGVEGIESKRANGRYEPDRRTWLKVERPYAWVTHDAARAVLMAILDFRTHRDRFAV